MSFRVDLVLDYIVRFSIQYSNYFCRLLGNETSSIHLFSSFFIGTRERQPH